MTYTRMALLAIVSLANLSAITPSALAQKENDDGPETNVVIRISREFLRRHLNPAVDSMRPVDRCLFGAHVTGNSETHGQTTIDLQAHTGEATFTLRFAGTTTNNTVAQRSIVEVYSTGRTSFEATRVVHFDGVRFTAGPANYTASQCTSINGIETPGGIRGRIAYRRATQQVAANRAQGDAIAVAENRELVMSRFEEQTEAFVNELNRIVPVEKTIALLIPKTRGYINHLETTPNWLLASPGPKDATIPTLPKEALRMRAPVEVWIRGRPEGERQRNALEMWSTLNTGLNRFRAKVKGEQPKVEGLKLTAVGEWWVIKVGEDLVEDWLDKQLEKVGE